MSKLKITDRERETIVGKFRKYCISTWTSKQFMCPPMPRETAIFRAMDVCLFLDSVLREYSDN